MKTYRTAAVAAGLIGMLGIVVPAVAAPGYHPRRLEVNGRLFNQQRRINAGVRDGQLTHQEAHQLRSNDRAIYGEEKEEAKLDGGHITKADQRSLNQQESANSKLIHQDRHD